MRYSTLNRSQKGFTIIELMVATTVLSVILLLITTMMIGIGNLFYKGINQARVQDATRSITDEVSKQLASSGNVPGGGMDAVGGRTINVYCIGTTRYSYILNIQMSSSLHHVLWRDTPSGGCKTNTAADLTRPNPNEIDGATNGMELVSPNSRLTAFCIGSVDQSVPLLACNNNFVSPYNLTVSIAYGDNDLLCDRGTPGDCPPPPPAVHDLTLLKPKGEVGCVGQSGDQFCATASLTTTVASRLPVE